MTDVLNLHTLRGEWTGLWLRSEHPSVFLSWEWMNVWTQTWRRHGTPYVVLMRRQADGALIGLAPLVRLAPRLPLWLRTLIFMGTGVGADHLAFLSQAGMERQVYEGVFRHLLSSARWDLLELLRMDERQAAYVRDAVARGGAEVSGYSLTVADVCPFIPLPKTWDDYLRVIGKHNRKDLARRWRRLREQGEIVIQRVQTGSELERAWGILLRLHQARRSVVGGRSAFVSGPSTTFHQGFLRVALDRGWLRLYLLYVNARCVAAEYCLSAGGRVCDVQTGFDVQWGRYGVGTLLLAHAIQEAVAEGASEFDLLRGGETYKQQRWAAHLRRDVSLVIYRRRSRARWSMSARQWRSRLKARLRGRLRRPPASEPPST